MKIFSGALKGTKLKIPKGSSTRPTSAKVREAALNFLRPYIQDSNFIDIFSGSGAVGIEALSNGADCVTFIENNKNAYSTLLENISLAQQRLKRQEITQPTECFNKDLKKIWSQLKSQKPFDIIWADPPYQDSLDWLSFFSDKLDEISSQEAVFIMETSSGLESKIEISNTNWVILRQKKYGSVLITIWQKQEEKRSHL
ncbi:MAG: 16S rRNA (guanine(966)-N(2))-methyltransferase RsmD [Zetaproteobacteria bacterium]|nr:16S rRNA (guanine(966)-N(2))-methyltransferase RsmD [Pseudobdellovibrionaceae bacterium]|tara:strand:+ start:964 stop:1560 length:597 start_codon:yes stop_codon:yes gene_type:complete